MIYTTPCYHIIDYHSRTHTLLVTTGLHPLIKLLYCLSTNTNILSTSLHLLLHHVDWFTVIHHYGSIMHLSFRLSLSCLLDWIDHVV